MSYWKCLPSIAILIVLGILPTFAARIQRHDHFMRVSPQFLISELSRRIPMEKCSRSESYFRSCFQINQDECQRGLERVFRMAGGELFDKKWKERIELHLTGHFYALEIGSRAGELFEEQFKAQKKSREECFRKGAFPQ